MTKMLWKTIAAAIVMSCVGCGSGGAATSTVEDADQSAIEAYQAAQKADQEAMDSSLGDGGN